MITQEKLIVALDVSDLSLLQKQVKELSPYVSCFKIGLEAMTSLGVPSLVHKIHEMGGKVFLDGKFCDIPHTVQMASRAAAQLKVSIFNVHASSGIESIQAAAKEKKSSKLFVVTVLTSMSEQQARHVFGDSIEKVVLRFAKDAKEGGADGLICSPLELDVLANDSKFSSLEKITPGVRPVWAALQDQKRTMTPQEAIQKGATAIVVGRPITNPPSHVGSSVDAVKKILDELR